MNIELMKCKCLLIYTWENLNFKLRFSNILCIIYVVRILCHFHNFMKTQMSQVPLANVKPLLIFSFLSLFWVNDIDLFYKKSWTKKNVWFRGSPRTTCTLSWRIFVLSPHLRLGLYISPINSSKAENQERERKKEIWPKKKKKNRKERKKEKKERKQRNSNKRERLKE